MKIIQIIACFYNIFSFAFSFDEDPIICVQECVSCPRIPISPVPAGFTYEELNGNISKSICASFICCHCIPCFSYSQEHETMSMKGALNFYCCASCNYLELKSNKSKEEKKYEECCFLCSYAYLAKTKANKTCRANCMLIGATCSTGEESGLGFDIFGIGCFLGKLKKAITCCLYEY